MRSSTLLGLTNMKITSHVLAGIPETSWQSATPRGGEREQILWYPIASLTDGRYREGITILGDWATETADGVVPLTRETCPLMLACLELGREDITRRLESGLKGVRTSQLILDSFPFVEIVVCGLTSNDYWASLALRWLDSMEVGPTEEPRVLEALRALSQDKGRASQRTRHLARRLLHRTER